MFDLIAHKEGAKLTENCQCLNRGQREMMLKEKTRRFSKGTGSFGSFIGLNKNDEVSPIILVISHGYWST